MANYFPPVPVYPKSYDSDSTLFLVFNTSETITTVDNFPWADEILIKPVAADKGEIWAENGFANIAGELFYYDTVEKNENNKIYKLKRCARNLGGTHTKHNLAGSEVRGFVVAEHHNQIADAIIKVENFIGENFTDNQTTLDWRIRNLKALPNIFDDYTCPDVIFDFLTISDDPASGVVVQYDITITGTFTSYRLEFGDGEFTTSSTSGTHTYAPNANIDPVVTISNSKCAVIQTPITRISAAEPTGQIVPSRFEIQLPSIPNLPSFNIPVPPIPSMINIPPFVGPCLNVGSIGPINIPSVIVVDPPINIPSHITVDPLVIPSNIEITGEFNFPSTIDISIPSMIEFGPANLPSVIEFGPIDIPTIIEFGGIELPTVIEFAPAPEIPTEIIFGDAPIIPTEITFGDAPIIPTEIIFGDAPVIPTLITFGAAPFIPPTITFGPAPYIPPIITFGDVTLPSSITITGEISIPSSITITGDISIPSSITITGEISIPSIIEFGDAPTFSPIGFDAPPTITVDWGTPPTLSCIVTVECPSPPPPFMARQSTKTFAEPITPAELDPIPVDFGDLGIPSEIVLKMPEIPDIRIIHDIPFSIKVEEPNIPDIRIIESLPREIKVVSDVPSIIELRGFDLPKSITLDSSDLPRSIKLEVPEIPSIKFDTSMIPSFIQVVGFPSSIELKGPSEIKLVMPEKPEIEMVYRGAPINVKVDLDISRLTGENNQKQCVSIVPCNS